MCTSSYLTAKGQEVDRQKGLEMGADRYMTKPFDPDEMLSVAEEILKLYRSEPPSGQYDVNDQGKNHKTADSCTQRCAYGMSERSENPGKSEVKRLQMDFGHHRYPDGGDSLWKLICPHGAPVPHFRRTAKNSPWSKANRESGRPGRRSCCRPWPKRTWKRNVSETRCWAFTGRST